MSIIEKQEQLVQQFSELSEWMDRYALLIEKGKECPVLPESDKNESFLIKGCQSRVWIKAESKDGKVYFKADSDAVITKGIAALLIYVFSGETPQDIVNAPVDFLDRMGLKEHLSPTRSNGLTAMLKQIKLYALALSIKKP
ncbi:MAG: SufE family protein [Lentimicrobiaceae bacterium]|nr:SufE family protein [Lentimicrobiaceae bacterium]